MSQFHLQLSSPHVRLMSVCSALLLVAFFGSLQAEAARKLLDRLPAWPISNVGDPIPEELIRYWSGGVAGSVRIGEWCPGIKGEYKPFPAKAPVIPGPSYIANKKDPNDLCGDGDQTSYNGYLCAAGIKQGCEAVAAAQDKEGRWYRSPHRVWVWANRCFDDDVDPTYFRDRCAHGFSPDMGLGVMLYALTTKDVRSFKRWLKWLDNHAASTELCAKGSDGKINRKDCIKIEWPRVCPEDLGFADDPGVAIPTLDGKQRYGGQCALRPPDALDYAAVSKALGIPLPRRLSKWNVTSRLAMRTMGELASAIVPIPKPAVQSPLILLSAVNPDDFTLHLDAIRVLIRMTIRNPSLKMRNLPDLPSSADLSPSALNLISSDGTDVASINIAAKIIASRDPDNAFYRLLADGPTPDVRSLILNRCPAIGANQRDPKNSEHGHSWIWEIEPGKPHRAKVFSMGWDCTFVGSLFNKMRVKKDLAEELLDLFLDYANPINGSLQRAQEALQVAQVSNDLQLSVLRETETALKNTKNFVDTHYNNLKNAAQRAITDAGNELKSLSARELDLKNKISNSVNELNRKKDKVWKEVDKICSKIGGGDIGKLVKKLVCKPVMGWVDNPVKKKIKDRINSFQNQLQVLQTSLQTAALSNLQLAQEELAKLDKRLTDERQKLEGRVLQKAVEVARKKLQLTNVALEKARNILSEAERANATIESNIAVWRNDDNKLKSVTYKPDVDKLFPDKKSEEADKGDPTGKAKLRKRKFVSIVGSFKTQRGAERHKRDLLRKDKTLTLDVFLPYRRSKYWIVANAVDVTLDKAREEASYARRNRLQHDSYVLFLPNAVKSRRIVARSETRDKR